MLLTDYDNYQYSQEMELFLFLSLNFNRTHTSHHFGSQTITFAHLISLYKYVYRLRNCSLSNISIKQALKNAILRGMNRKKIVTFFTTLSGSWDYHVCDIMASSIEKNPSIFDCAAYTRFMRLSPLCYFVTSWPVDKKPSIFDFTALYKQYLDLYLYNISNHPEIHLINSSSVGDAIQFHETEK